VFSLETREASGIPRDAAFTKPRKAVLRVPEGFACHRTPKDLSVYMFCDLYGFCGSNTRSYSCLLAKLS
jgi:hypothetical protein